MCGLRKVKMTSVSCRIFPWSIMDQESPGQDLWKLNSFHIAISKAAKRYFWPNLKNLPAVQETGVWSLGWEDSLQKVMATHSSVLAWKVPWTEEPGMLQSMGSLRVGHDWATSLSLFTFMHWRRKWQPTPVFLPGESHGWWSLAGYNPWGRKESDTTEWLTH